MCQIKPEERGKVWRADVQFGQMSIMAGSVQCQAGLVCFLCQMKRSVMRNMEKALWQTKGKNSCNDLLNNRKGNAMSEQELVNGIERFYGFKKELIRNVEQCGLWFVRFTVNNINYCGSISHAGAEPQLAVAGYTYKYYWQGTPVTEEYYKEFIEGQTIYLRKCIDAESGEWEWLEKTFKTPEEAEDYIETLDNPAIYGYDIRCE